MHSKMENTYSFADSYFYILYTHIEVGTNNVEMITQIKMVTFKTEKKNCTFYTQVTHKLCSGF